jgi:hypothetical protein
MVGAIRKAALVVELNLSTKKSSCRTLEMLTASEKVFSLTCDCFTCTSHTEGINSPAGSLHEVLGYIMQISAKTSSASIASRESSRKNGHTFQYDGFFNNYSLYFFPIFTKSRETLLIDDFYLHEIPGFSVVRFPEKN